MRQYQVGGWLVLHCATLLIHSGSTPQSLLAYILPKILTPNDAFSPSWNVSLIQKKAIGQSLPTYLKGILTYPDFENNKFLSRKITEIIRIYLPRFEPQSHPFKGILSNPPLIADEAISGRVVRLTIPVLDGIINDNRFKSPSVSAASLR